MPHDGEAQPVQAPGGYRIPRLEPEDFRRFSRLIYRKAGIHLHEGKQGLVQSRLAGRLREGGFPSFRAYYEHVVSDASGMELSRLLDAITTNLTRFFREEAHFAFLREQVLPEILEGIRCGGRPNSAGLWSAGCSTGEEIYSLVMHVLDSDDGSSALRWSFLATDISASALKNAKRAIYPREKLEGLPENMIKAYFLRGSGPWEGYVKVKPRLRSMVRFRRHNLTAPPPVSEPLDVIFCRNVMIYFDRRTRQRVVSNLTGVLRSGGYLFVGHAENLRGLDMDLVFARPAVYRKP